MRRTIATLIGAALLPAAAEEAATAGAPARAEAAPPSKIGLEFVRLPAGEYWRGMDGGDTEHEFLLEHLYSTKPSIGSEQPAHGVVISKPFDLARTEVTVAQFRKFVDATGYKTDAEKGEGALGLVDPENRDFVDRYRVDSSVTWRDPGFEQTPEHPVVAVSWRDATAFCEWLGEAEGVEYRLPSEAEWEYACRAGGKDWYSWGRDPDLAYEHANVADAALENAHDEMVSYQRAVRLKPGEGDGHVYTAPVASAKANAWGLYDMHGNVWEWCRDRWQGSRYKEIIKDVPRPERNEYRVTDPVFLEETDQHEYGDWRTIRGGAWNCAPANVRASIRTYQEAEDATVYTGFRVLREVDGE